MVESQLLRSQLIDWNVQTWMRKLPGNSCWSKVMLRISLRSRWRCWRTDTSQRVSRSRSSKIWFSLQFFISTTETRRTLTPNKATKKTMMKIRQRLPDHLPSLRKKITNRNVPVPQVTSTTTFTPFKNNTRISYQVLMMKPWLITQDLQISHYNRTTLLYGPRCKISIQDCVVWSPHTNATIKRRNWSNNKRQRLVPFYYNFS